MHPGVGVLPHSAAMKDPIVIDVHGGLEGRYVVEEQRPDGALVIRPEFSVAQVLEKHDERRVTHEEIPAWLRELPTDGEG